MIEPGTFLYSLDKEAMSVWEMGRSKKVSAE